MSDKNQSKPPRVSVVIPTRNKPALVEKAIASVLAQKNLPPETIEILVVDGHSDDDTPAALAGLATRYPTLVFPLQGTGNNIASWRNVGIKAARGEFIAFLDGEDVFVPDRLAVALAVFDSDTAGEPQGDPAQKHLRHPETQ